MKKLIILMFILSWFVAKPQEWNQIWIRYQINLGDSSVTKIYPDTLINPKWVRDYFNSLSIPASGNAYEIQFNNGGFLGADSDFKFKDDTLNIYKNITSTTDTTKINGVFQVGSNYEWNGNRLKIVADSGVFNVFAGLESGDKITSGGNNTFFGYRSGYNNTTANNNVYIGSSAALINETGIDNVIIGKAANNNGGTDVDNSVIIGKDAGGNSTGDGNILIGYQAGALIGAESNKLYIDNSNTANPLIWGDFANDSLKFNGIVQILNNYIYNDTTLKLKSAVGTDNLFIGDSSGINNQGTGNYNVFLGIATGRSNTTGDYNTYLGSYAGRSNTITSRNTFVGSFSGYTNITGQLNTFLGFESGYTNNDGVQNTFLGLKSGYSNISGDYNTFTGYQSGYNNIGNSNAFYGYESGYSNTNGTGNVFMGYYSGRANTGSFNTYYGYQSGYSNVSGTGNVFLGYRAGRDEVGSNKLYIHNTSGTPLIKGDFSTNELWFNTDTTHIVGHEIIDSSIILKRISTQTHKEGRLYYDEITRSVTFNNDILGFDWNLGREFVARVYNNTGSQINNGDLVTIDSSYINGFINPTVHLAGNMSYDSILGVGMATVNIPNESYGEVTLFGAVNFLDLSAFNNKDAIYVDNAGGITNIKPSPPSIALRVGYVIYADNDSGQLYMFPGDPSYDPLPHISADTSEISQTVTITTQDVYEYIPISTINTLQDNLGFILQGDSIQIKITGHYENDLSMSFQGNAATEVWRYGVFKNNIMQHTKTRTTSTSASGDVKVSILRYYESGDWISFRIKNESTTGDPTIVDLSYYINFIHE